MIANDQYRFSTLFAAIAMMVAFAVEVRGEPRASIEPRQPQLFDVVTFSIQHSGSLEGPTRPPPASGNLQAMAEVRRQSSFSSVTGRTETLSWQYDAVEPGEFQIGPVDVIVDGQRVRVPEINGVIRPVTVEGSRLPAEAAEIAGNPNPLESGDRALARHLTGNAFIYVNVPDNLVVGWPFRVDTYVFVSARLNSVEERRFVPTTASGTQFVVIPEHSGPLRTSSSQLVELGGEPFRRYHVHSTAVVPTRAGTTEIKSGKMNIEFMARGRSFTRNLLTTIAFDPSRREVEIQPLPERLEGSHIQVVGDHTIGATVEPAEVRQGELVTLTVRVSGNGYLEMASLDRMPEIEGLIFVREEISSRIDVTRSADFASTKTFRRTYQAEGNGLVTIPRIAMANYDPRTDRQEMRFTEQMQISVRPSEGSTQVLGSRSPREAVAADAREIGGGGILHIDTSPLNLQTLASGRGQLSSQSILANRWFWILHGVALVGTLVFVSIVAMGRFVGPNAQARQAAARKSQVAAALKRAEHSQSADEFYSSLHSGLMNQLGLTIGREPGALTVEDALAGLREHGADEKLVADLGGLLDRCQSARYSPSWAAQTLDEDMDRAKRIIRQLEGLRQ